MGSVRVLLAIAVVVEHSFGMAFSGGVFAVQLFFVVSGFYISYILVEAQSYATVRGFYWNRILRRGAQNSCPNCWASWLASWQ